MKINVNGQMVDGERVSITTSDEQWSRFTLSDGSVLKVRATLNSVARIMGAFTNQGDPAYNVDVHMAIVAESAPDHLRIEAQAKEAVAVLPSAGKVQ